MFADQERTVAGNSGTEFSRSRFISPTQPRLARQHPAQRSEPNIGQGERAASVAAGAILAFLGLGRRDAAGLIIASVGGALAIRGASGHCPVYSALDVDGAAAHKSLSSQRARLAESGVHVSTAYLINKSPETLYAFWRNFENLPKFMSHLESVRVNDNQLSHWVAKAPSIYGGTVEWDAELTAEQPDSYLAWRSTPGSDVMHEGSIRFAKALGDRGTMVSVVIKYSPPLGQAGRWIAKLFGEEPHQQISEDLRNFKRLMELGELPTIEGQPQGTCGR